MSFLVFIVSLLFFLFFQTTSIYGGDAGDLVTSAYLHGVAHPPGFPLYTFLGFLASKLPISTVAFRVGLLSSFSGAGTIAILFLLLRDITRNRIASLLAVCSLGTTYLFWLYTSVPEVFMFHNFFVVSLIYLLYKWSVTKQEKYLSFFTLTLGLSLSHHLLVLFLFPGFVYFVFSNKKLLPKLSLKYFVKKLGIFMTGLSPHLYVFAAASTIPAISWDNVTNISNFFSLILRKSYGTFQSGPSFAQSFVSRLIQFPYMGEFMINDFTIMGVLLAIIGCIAQFRKRRKLWNFFFILFIFTGPFYFFYASYYIIDSFSLATFERFLLPSYMIIAIWLGEGIVASHGVISRYTKKSLAPIFYLLFLILPVSLFFINYPKISILKYDRTAENHAIDILATVPKNSIMILQYDTTLFNTQYVYYTQKLRPDIKLIHFTKLFLGQLTDQLEKYYPELHVPKSSEAKFMDEFILVNSKKFPVYVNTDLPLSVKDSYWVRQGLLFRFYTKDTLPTASQIFAENERLWKIYSDPLSGSLGKYQNLMLSNVISFYKDARLELGRLYEAGELYDDALIHYKQARRLDPRLPEAPYRMGIVYAKQGACTQSRKYLNTAIAIDPKKADYYYSMSQLFKNCFKDPSKAAVYERMYQEMKNASQVPVEQL